MEIFEDFYLNFDVKNNELFLHDDSVPLQENITITFDTSKPDGAPRKWMDSNRLESLGWQPKVTLEQGLIKAYAAFQDASQ